MKAHHPDLTLIWVVRQPGSVENIHRGAPVKPGGPPAIPAGLSRLLEKSLGPDRSLYEPIHDRGSTADRSREFLAATDDPTSPAWLGPTGSPGPILALARRTNPSPASPEAPIRLWVFSDSDALIVIWSLGDTTESDVDPTQRGWFDGAFREASRQPEWERALALWSETNSGCATKFPGLMGGLLVVDWETGAIAGDEREEHLRAARHATADGGFLPGGDPCRLGEGSAVAARIRDAESGSDDESGYFDQWLILSPDREADRLALAKYLAYGRTAELPLIPRYVLHGAKCRRVNSAVRSAKQRLRTNCDNLERVLKAQHSLVGVPEEPKSHPEDSSLDDIAHAFQLFGSAVEDQERRHATIRVAAHEMGRMAGWLAGTNLPANCLFEADREFSRGALLQAEVACQYGRASRNKIEGLVSLYRTAIERARLTQEEVRREAEERFAHRIHLLEVFIVGFYVLHLGHILSEWGNQPYSLAWVPFVGGLAVIAYLFLGPGSRGPHRGKPTGERRFAEPLVLALAIVALISIAVFAAWKNPGQHRLHKNPDDHSATNPPAKHLVPSPEETSKHSPPAPAAEAAAPHPAPLSSVPPDEPTHHPPATEASATHPETAPSATNTAPVPARPGSPPAERE